MKSIKLAMFAGALVLLSSGCASVPLADAGADANAKTFQVPVDKSAIYVYRNETFGAAVKMPVVLDGKAMGSTAANTYFRWIVDPGQHTIISRTENDAKLTIDAKPGEDYYVWQEVKMGLWSAGSQLHKVSEAEGRAGVRECKLIAPYQ
ncbi:MAG TPA: DUF2846 domain-containing protein [Gammaproteobacteria bacterium]